MSDTPAKKETTDIKTDKDKKTLSLGGKGTLSLGSAASAKAKQTLTGAGSSGVAVEIRRSRKSSPPPAPKTTSNVTTGSGAQKAAEARQSEQNSNASSLDEQGMTSSERGSRIEALQQAIAEEEARKVNAPAEEAKKEDERKAREAARQKELDELKRIEEDERAKAAAEKAKQNENPASKFHASTDARPASEAESYRDRLKKAAPRKDPDSDRRRSGKLTVTQVLNRDYDRDRGQSLAALKRARAKAKAQAEGPKEAAAKIMREVTLPETITVGDLANRMSEKSGDVIKKLMSMGVMATITQTIDADTAELIVDEFGHSVTRVTEADVEIGLNSNKDNEKDLVSRPPVVTIMGHVDHGKTSLLDAMRKTDVVSGEAGGITQHIGAYQIESKDGQKITFLDTPGHAAFTEMRARGANVTDIVIIVVAANDSIMPQTIEAINHAKAAEVPMIIAINKIDLADANPMKVKQDLLMHEVIVEELSGDVQCVEVSAKGKMNLDKLEEAICLQAELLDLKANPNREANGTVVEAKLEQGRGSVATVLIDKGTLKIGDIFVAGGEWGRVRAIVNDKGKNVKTAIPGQPVEVLGINGTPDAGDFFNVVDSEARAREIVDYRQRKKADNKAALAAGGSSLEVLMAAAKHGEKKSLPIVIKADVHGSVEALMSSLEKITEENDEVSVKILHAGVGGITESDITLAKASSALVVGFNVRANAQARDAAKQDGVDMRYYNIIYNVIDDAKAILSGMLSPLEREVFIGQAEIREVFNITKAGKVGGCMVKEGFVKRGAHVRLLRDDVVIHEGKLKTLKRFKDEVKEVSHGTECGMAFEKYEDIKAGDIIECFEIKEEARTID